eukprot:14108685-Alexandrium_andersonii.AAC.1
MQQPPRPSTDGLVSREQPCGGRIDGVAVQGQPDGRAPDEEVLGRELAQPAQRTTACGVWGGQPV